MPRPVRRYAPLLSGPRLSSGAAAQDVLPSSIVSAEAWGTPAVLRNECYTLATADAPTLVLALRQVGSIDLELNCAVAPTLRVVATNAGECE